jgi:hypothetical protein
MRRSVGCGALAGYARRLRSPAKLVDCARLSRARRRWLWLIEPSGDADSSGGAQRRVAAVTVGAAGRGGVAAVTVGCRARGGD